MFGWKWVRSVVAIGTGLFLLGLTGCNYLRTFPLYSELYIEHRDFIELKHIDDPRWWDYPMLASIRQRVEVYCTTHTDVPPDICESLRHLTIRRGMDTEQIVAVLGLPRIRQRLTDVTEVWTYDQSVEGVRRWYYSWGKLRFDRGILVDIEAEYINIHK